jgi:putative endonuclease
MSKARVRAYRDGVLAETLAAILFSLKGYRIIARRYRSPVGEVDLVATNGERLAFVEVKRRKTQADAAFAVTAKQKRRIMRAAQYWLSSHPPPISSTTLLASMSCFVHFRPGHTAQRTRSLSDGTRRRFNYP